MTSIKLGAVDTRSSVLAEIGCGLIPSTPAYLSIIYYSIVYNDGLFSPTFENLFADSSSVVKGLTTLL